MLTDRESLKRSASLVGAMRRAGLRQQMIAEVLGLSEGEFSRRIHGRKDFTPLQQAQLSELLDVEVEELFHSRPATPIARLLADVGSALDGGDPCLLLERIRTAEPREHYLAVVRHALAILRERTGVKNGTAVHFRLSWGEGFKRVIIEARPAVRAGEDSLRFENGEIHPIQEDGTDGR